MSTFTPAQQQAIGATGNVLVMAGAGAGKTRTLVERCVARLLSPQAPIGLDEMLLVTFTEAAAAEMRKRIRERLEAELERQPGQPRLTEQLALLDTALICTLHSFCLQLVRQHFHELGLDPQVMVLEEAQAQVLAQQNLDNLLQEQYQGGAALAEAVQALIAERGRGWDKPIRHLVLRLRAYAQSLPNPDAWLNGQLAVFGQTEPRHWQKELEDGFREWREKWPAPLKEWTQVPNVAQCLAALEALPPKARLAEAAETLRAIDEARQQGWPRGTAGKVRDKALADFFRDLDFFWSFLPSASDPDPLGADWEWVRHQMLALLRLTREFGQRFADAKRGLAVVDFQDLEQCALRLLRGPDGAPTATARAWRRKLKLVFVDEYQDINGAQDAILTALGRDGADANRFLVGDVKQSIYRFRRADPRIFQELGRAWRGPEAPGQVIALSENFRSHETILNFLNPLFTALLRPETGGVEYDPEARLQFGGRAGRAAMSAQTDPQPRVELLLRLTGQEAEAAPEEDAGAEEEPGTPTEWLEAEKEARLVGRRLWELKHQPCLVWDSEQQARRPAEWRDMVVLLRSPRAKAESYAKEFERLGLPLLAPRGGFFNALEVCDLLNLLRLLDNPLQDLPLLAVLRSPLAGFAPDELAIVRARRRKGLFWTALQAFHRNARENAPAPQNGAAASLPPDLLETARAKTDLFLRRYTVWREMVRREALSHCLEQVLDETGYEAWAAAQTRGRQRTANVQQLLALARQFDPLRRQGLFRFLQFVEAREEAEVATEPACVEAENTVRLMSIHQAKGLEFPIVVVADLGKRFNLKDAAADIILDERQGLCPKVRPPRAGQTYPSVAHWRASRRQRTAILGEELRLLYVATTRACDRLILAGSASQKQLSEKWSGGLAPAGIMKANSYLDWIVPLFAQAAGSPEWFKNREGKGPLAAWRLFHDADLAEIGPAPGSPVAVSETRDLALDGERLAGLNARLAWCYPWADAVAAPAKTSVSALRRRLIEETEAEAKPWFDSHRPPWSLGETLRSGQLSATARGNAHHLFLQMVSLERAGTMAGLEQEAERLVRVGCLTPLERMSLDFKALVAFWRSDLGQRILGQAAQVHRELPFTARLTGADLAELENAQISILPADEFIVVQGVVDLAVLQPAEIWLLDFKTDRVEPDKLPDKVNAYRPQLQLYALALERIYCRPVTCLWLHFLSPGHTVTLQ